MLLHCTRKTCNWYEVLYLQTEKEAPTCLSSRESWVSMSSQECVVDSGRPEECVSDPFLSVSIIISGLELLSLTVKTFLDKSWLMACFQDTSSEMSSWWQTSRQQLSDWSSKKKSSRILLKNSAEECSCPEYAIPKIRGKDDDFKMKVQSSSLWR